MVQAATVHEFTPRGPRWDVDHDVVARDQSGRTCKVRIANLSNGGFMAESDCALPIGSVLTLDMPGEGEVQAEVRWAIGERFGAVIVED